jgi:hypothetical protein
MRSSSRIRLSLSFIWCANLTLSFAYFFLSRVINVLSLAEWSSTHLNERYDCFVGAGAGASGIVSDIAEGNRLPENGRNTDLMEEDCKGSS